MADDSKPNNFANNSIILAALISTGALIFQNLVAPLQNARPPADVTQLHEAASAQDLDARLWQDPFAVVANVESDFAHAGDCTDKHGVNHCLKPDEQLKAFGGLDPDDQPDIFWVTMSGAPYFAEEEERRRIRYAVVSALNVRGFAPFDPTHTGYYRHRKPPSYIIPIADKPEGSGDFFPQNAIPFDLFEERAPTTAKPHKIIVAWVNEDLLGRNPLVQLRKLKEEIREPRAVVGPQTSAVLQNFASEAWRSNPALEGSASTLKAPCAPATLPFKLYAFGATAPDMELLKSIPLQKTEASLHDFLKCRGIDLFRTVATDDILARALTAELDIRGVDLCSQHIATVSEFDTLYGRSLPDTVEHVRPRDCKNQKPLERLSYLRGLDGALPQSPRRVDETSRNEGSSAAAANKNAAKYQPDPKALDQPFGQAQNDYLRRLASDLKGREDQFLRNGEGRIKAIGVLGNDVFDKLLVLRALKPQFPEAVFFTTDYDASLFEIPSELPWTRNLIIASSFGPKLRPELQGDIPPFRDTYEASAFLATQLAVQGVKEPKIAEANEQAKIKNLRSEVGVFEVDRSGEMLTFPQPGQTGASGKKAGLALSPSNASKRDLKCKTDLDCDGANAGLEPPYPKSATALLAIIGPCWLFTIISLFVLNARYERQKPKTWDSLAIWLFWPIVAFLWFIILFHSWSTWPLMPRKLTDSGEPIAFMRGVSVFMPLVIHIFGLILCIWLIFLSLRELTKNLYLVCMDLGLKGVFNPRCIIKETKGANPSLWYYALYCLDIRYFYRVAPARNGEFTVSYNEWSTITLNSWWPHRIARVSLFWMPVGFFFLLISFAVFGFPADPVRGPLMRNLHLAVILADVICMWFLIFVVVDATLFLGLFVWRLANSKSRWPSGARNHFAKQLGLTATASLPTAGAPAFKVRKLNKKAPAFMLRKLNKEEENILDDWIDLQFIARRTKCINSLVWYPFTIVALMIVSRSTIFANFPFSPPIAIAQGSGLFLIFACAFGLNWCAEKQRREAQDHLRDEITRARNAGENTRADQWQGMLDRVTNLHEGSFRNFLQQPVVAGLLLPLGSLGSTTLLQQGHLFGL